MRFSEWLEEVDYKINVGFFPINGIIVEVVEILRPKPQTYRKFRISWKNLSGSSSVRYILASSPQEAVEMVRDDMAKASAPFQKSGQISGHKGLADINSVQEVNNITEVIKMLNMLLKAGRGLGIVDWFDVNIMLKAILNKQVNPEELKTVNYVINTLRKSRSSENLFSGKNWELLRKIKVVPMLGTPPTAQSAG